MTPISSVFPRLQGTNHRNVHNCLKAWQWVKSALFTNQSSEAQCNVPESSTLVRYFCFIKVLLLNMVPWNALVLTSSLLPSTSSVLALCTVKGFLATKLFHPTKSWSWAKKAFIFGQTGNTSSFKLTWYLVEQFGCKNQNQAIISLSKSTACCQVKRPLSEVYNDWSRAHTISIQILAVEPAVCFAKPMQVLDEVCRTLEWWANAD